MTSRRKQFLAVPDKEISNLVFDNRHIIVNYAAACKAIAAALRVDEVLEIRDRAKLIQLYVAEAKNEELERQAAEIRLRAERRVGELLKETALAKGGRPRKTDDTVARVSAKTLRELDVSPRQSSDWQRLAVPDDKEFAAILSRQNGVPSTRGVLESIRQGVEQGAKVIDLGPILADSGVREDLELTRQAQRFWDFVLSFEYHLAEMDPCALLAELRESQREDVERNLPGLIEWLRLLSRGGLRIAPSDSDEKGE